MVEQKNKQSGLKKQETQDKKVKKNKTGQLLIKLYDLQGKVKNKVKIPKEIFDIKASPRLIALYVRVYLANQRRGTATTKTRGEVRGSTRKIYKQKGTGRARHGDIKAPIFVGGGVVGGPRRRDFSLKINKKQKKKALFYSLTLKHQKGLIFSIDNQFASIEPKTKNVVNFFRMIKVKEKDKILIITGDKKQSLILAVRNIPNISIIDARSINAYQILNHKKIYFIKEGLEVFKKHFIQKNENK